MTTSRTLYTDTTRDGVDIEFNICISFGKVHYRIYANGYEEVDTINRHEALDNYEDMLNGNWGWYNYHDDMMYNDEPYL